ncbi:MAG: iron-containing alcohol dehydrogenase [Candidatus Marinimicrobia bacterium]|nr:iron-containing alcohol dehydrogenase [Candidatus Neomarinimicrobiota bacterium]
MSSPEYGPSWSALAEIIAFHDLAAPRRVLFGAGTLEQIGALAREIAPGGTVALITGRRGAAASTGAARAQALLTASGLSVWRAPAVHGEPTVASVDALAADLRGQHPALIIALGGGSVLDTAKALAALATHPGSIAAYLEGVPQQRQLTRAPLPVLAIPTTAGTGAEMTKNAVIRQLDPPAKRSLRAESLIPAAVIADPDLTLSLPPAITAAAGLDALTQLFEACISSKRTPGATAAAHLGLACAGDALLRAYHNPADHPARGRMLFAALCSGVALANAGLGLAHGLAAALGARHQIPHGLACGMLLPAVLTYNAPACRPQLAAALAALLHREAPQPDTLESDLGAISALNAALGVPADLRGLELTAAELPALAAAAQGNSLRGNPRPMTPENTLAFLRKVT